MTGNHWGWVRAGLVVLGLQLLLVQTGVAADIAPPCIAFGHEIHFNNEQVLNWKRSTQNQFKDRGHVVGNVSRVFPDRNGHKHFEINIGNKATDVVEIVYNVEFGAMPTAQVGQRIEACGDYITSTAQAGEYPPSPSGAIIHWVHFNPKDKNKAHDHGYVVIEGMLYGDKYHGKPIQPH